jgi:hypothetical protein
MTHATPPNAARQPTILDHACGPAELTADFLVGEIGRHASTDWRAGAWVLEHDPRFRPQFSTAGYERTAERSVVQVTLAAIEASDLPPELFHRVLLNLQAKGLGLVTPGAAFDD